MTNHTVDLLLKPISNGTFPVLRVDNDVFVFDKAGLHKIPAEKFPHSDAWIKLGKAALKTGFNVAVVAFGLYTGQFLTYNALLANPFQFISALVGLFDGLKLPKNFMELAQQDWEDITFDCKEILKLSCDSVNDTGRDCFDNLRSSGEFEGGLKFVFSYSEKGLTYIPAEQERPLEEIFLGFTTSTLTEVIEYCEALKRVKFEEYNSITRNCNHFCNELSKGLCGQEIPAKYRMQVPMALSGIFGTVLSVAAIAYKVIRLIV